jgi:hypothetical protein
MSLSDVLSVSPRVRALPRSKNTPPKYLKEKIQDLVLLSDILQFFLLPTLMVEGHSPPETVPELN